MIDFKLLSFKYIYDYLGLEPKLDNSNKYLKIKGSIDCWYNPEWFRDRRELTHGGDVTMYHFLFNNLKPAFSSKKK